VRTHTRLPQYNRPSCEVIRRFRDFVHLESQLAEKHRGIILPPLPEKNAVQKFQMSQEFIEDRRRALQVRRLRAFLIYVCVMFAVMVDAYGRCL
jgi:sorting nexin-1/2